MQNTRTLIRYQNDDMTLLIIELNFEILRQLKTWHGIHIAYTAQEMIHISSIACFQILLFAYILLYF